ncbi:MAG: HEAT repeat domain-containing protein, partial [Deltaproteobacteria bacterium]|nr:HEAT repeat domain-containing protein [Deltaproteobacteria bacterium]
MERALRTRFFALATFAAAGAAAAGASANAGFPVQRIAADGIAGIETGPTADVRENDAAVFRPRHLVDNLRWTPWCGTERGPQSVGGRIRFTFHSVRYVTQLEIVNGNIRSPKDLAEHVQTKAVLLRWDSGEQSFALARNQPEPQVLELPRPTPMRWLELEVREVYPGSGLGPCFTEIALMEPRDLLALQPAMLEEIQQLVGKLRQAEQAEQAAARLQEIGPPATPWIVSALKEKDAQLQVRVVRILAAIAEPSSGPVLEEAYRQSGDPELRQEILRAMAKVKSPSCVPFLVEQSHSKDTVVARLALLAMEGFGDDRTIQPFLQAVLYEEEPMARIAIRHLTGFGPRAYHALLPALGNPSLKVRERATWALGRIDSPAAREALLRQLQSGSMALAVAGLRGLGERNSEENFQIVSFNVQHEQPEIRIATAEALGGFAGNLEAVELLEKLAVDDQAEVRRQALASLSRMG